MVDPYPGFIREAFIDPIRSVLIVDDDYPTLQDFLLDDGDEDQAERDRCGRKRWKETRSSVRKVFQQFQGRGKPFLLDVHDGHNVSADEDEENISHLHQTDLLILDYQLDGEDDGNKAISIAKRLLQNAHFNLVLVHTAKETSGVFNAFLKSLLSAYPDWGIDEHALVEKIQNHEAAALGKEDLSFHGTLDDRIDFDHYIDFRHDPEGLQSRLMRRRGPWAPIRDVLQDAGFHVSGQDLLIRDYLRTFEENIAEQLSEDSLAGLSWGSPNNTENPWIRTDRAFFSFMKKDDGLLLQNLEASLINWAPKPSRLLLTKLRAEIDERGIEVQNDALDDSHAAALWYSELLKGTDSARRNLSTEMVRRHADQLLDQILPNVNNFVGRMADAEATSTDEEVLDRINEHYGLKLSSSEAGSKARAQHNAFVCSKAPSGWHLDIGHIFTLEDHPSGEAYWLCLSPACDLVPGQKRSGIFRDSAESKLTRFNAIRLRKVHLGPALKNANSNRFIFAKLGDSTAAFEFSPSADSLPQWDTMFAELDPEFETNREVNVRRLEVGPRGGAPALKTVRAKVVAQLRYEYAIHYNSLLGNGLARVGLDFRETPQATPESKTSTN